MTSDSMEEGERRMLRLPKPINLLTLAAALALSVGAPTFGQSDDSCRYHDANGTMETRFRFGSDRVRYDYPTYRENTSPVRRDLRTRNDRRYREVAPRHDFRVIESPRYDSTRTIGRNRYESGRGQFNEEWLLGGSGNSRDRDYFYSGFDYGNEMRRRPTDRRNEFVRPEFDRNRPSLRDELDRTLPLRDIDRDPELPLRRPSERDRYEQPQNGNSQGPTLNQKLSARYTDPTSIRFAQSLNGNQGLALFREVSTLIDQRHLSPKSYSDRVRSGARSLNAALENTAFQTAMRPVGSGSQIQSFRSQLNQLVNRNVRTKGEAEQVLASAMRLGQSVGLRPGVVAYEFTNAAIESLDKYSGLDPSLTRVSGSIDSHIQTAQSFDDQYMTGVGIEVKGHDDGLLIVRALRGGPAAAAGVRSGDVVVEINGRSLKGVDLNASVAMIGQSSQVRLRVSREGQGTGTFTVTRRRFRVYSVNDVKMIDRQDGVGYLHLNKFARNSATEMEQAIRELQGQGMRSLVVDVRGNPGGLLTTAIEVSDKFLKCGRIVATRGRLRTDNSVEAATANGTWNMPLVVLVDGDSASASEIFAAAIQENGRGIVVGQKSYGKGTVQTHFPLPSGMGTVRLTTAKFYSPSDREMSGAGVTPDVRTTDENETLRQAAAAASHPRLAEMVAQHGTCRPPVSNFGNFSSTARPTSSLSVLLNH